MYRRAALATAVTLCLISRGVLGQSPAASPGPAGTWRGTSLCLVKPSPCHDEVVVYRIVPMGTGDSLSLDAGKIVNGQEDDMGTLGCRFDPPAAELRCIIPQGTWRFTLRGDSLVGELRLPDGRTFRDVRAARAD